MSDGTMNTNEPELTETQAAYKWLFYAVMFVLNVALAVWAFIWFTAAACDWTVSVLHLAVFLFAMLWAVVWGDLFARE